MRNTNSRFKVGRFTSSNFPLTRKWSEEKIVSKKPGLNLNIKVNRIDSELEKIKKLGT